MGNRWTRKIEKIERVIFYAFWNTIPSNVVKRRRTDGKFVMEYTEVEGELKLIRNITDLFDEETGISVGIPWQKDIKGRFIR